MNIRNSNLRLGHVSSVDGSHIIVDAKVLKVQHESKEYNLTVGSFVNCGSGTGDVLCLVSRAYEDLVERTVEGERKLVPIRKLELVVVGTIEARVGFRRGVDQLPAVGTDAYFVPGETFEEALELGLTAEEKARLFAVGQRVGSGTGEARLDLDKLFGRHLAILGTTGSGKSYSVASLAQSVLDSYANPRLVILDIHNEYSKAFSKKYADRSTAVTWSSFLLPYWALNFREFVAIFVGDRVGSVQEQFLRTTIQEVKLESNEELTEQTKKQVSVDTPIPYDFNAFSRLAADKISTLGAKKDRDSLTAFMHRINSRKDDPRYAFLFRDSDNKTSLAEFFAKLFGVQDRQSHVTVLDLSGLPAEVRATSIGVLGRMVYQYRYWDYSPEDLPVALILEEAHTYIPERSDSQYSLCLSAMERIAKEGRKFGLSLVVVSQRPTNVSPTILSQCGTFIALRLTSDLDQRRVQALLPDTLGGQSGLLSSLRDGEAIISGDGVSLPGRVRFRQPSPTPSSSDVPYHKSWKDGPPPGYDLKGVTDRWVNQERSQND